MATTKEEIRESQKLLRSLLPKERKEEASKAACSFLLEALKGKVILSFASTPLEISLWPLNKQLAMEDRLALAKVTSSSLKIYKVKDLSTLLLSPWGILEPDPEKCPLLSDVDIALVPALAFSESHRIGYGKGHFDRFLEGKSFTRWGVGFKEEKVQALPVEAHDQPLNSVYLF